MKSTQKLFLAFLFVLGMSLCVSTPVNAVSKKKVKAAYKQILLESIDDYKKLGYTKAILVDINQDGVKELIVGPIYDYTIYQFKKGQTISFHADRGSINDLYYNKKKKTLACEVPYGNTAGTSYDYCMFYKFKKGAITTLKGIQSYNLKSNNYKHLKPTKVTKKNIKKFLKKI